MALVLVLGFWLREGIAWLLRFVLRGRLFRCCDFLFHSKIIFVRLVCCIVLCIEVVSHTRVCVFVCSRAEWQTGSVWRSGYLEFCDLEFRDLEFRDLEFRDLEFCDLEFPQR